MTSLEDIEDVEAYVGDIASKLEGRGVEYGDLVQEGLVALYECRVRYDPERGSFSTFARPNVEREVKKALARYGGSGAALSLSDVESINRYVRARREAERAGSIEAFDARVKARVANGLKPL